MFLSDASAANDKGKMIFETKGCNLCHQRGADTIGPALRTISKSYYGKESTLISYLKGQGEPIVDPARAAVMNPQLVKIRMLFDEDIKALAEHIISETDPVY